MSETKQIGSPSKIELGGGTRPRGEGFINMDILDCADIRCDLEKEDWPLPDSSVNEIYSSHFLEHIANTPRVLHEIVRVCRVGAHVEIRVPHWLQSMALCTDHKKTISPTQVRHWCQDFIDDWWRGCKKRLKLIRTTYIPGEGFGEAKNLFGWLTDDQLMRFIPDACHEVRFEFTVIAHDQ